MSRSDEWELVARILAGRSDIVRALDLVAALKLPDAWIGAGFIRNAVWDEIFGFPPRQRRTAGDVDVVYFDRADASPDRDRALEAALGQGCPELAWSVSNQARMHVKTGAAPYTSVADAIANWPETVTAIAAQKVHGRTQILAPWGVRDLLSGVVRPTGGSPERLAAFEKRLTEKAWTTRWPRLVVRHDPPVGEPDQ